MVLAGRLEIPDSTSALLLDMDGVLLDTLTFEYTLVTRLLGIHAPEVEIPNSVIRQYFAVPIPEFWAAITAAVGLHLTKEALDDTVEAHVAERNLSSFPVHEGVPGIIQAAKAAGLVLAVVSNNSAADIRQLLDAAGVSIEILVGNDQPGIRSKPSPDMYLEGARRVGFPPAQCVAVEDSLLGAEAAARAGCYVVAVATGANTFTQLASSRYVQRVYERFSTQTPSGST